MNFKTKEKKKEDKNPRGLSLEITSCTCGQNEFKLLISSHLIIILVSRSSNCKHIVVELLLMAATGICYCCNPASDSCVHLSYILDMCFEYPFHAQVYETVHWVVLSSQILDMEASALVLHLWCSSHCFVCRQIIFSLKFVIFLVLAALLYHTKFRIICCYRWIAIKMPLTTILPLRAFPHFMPHLIIFLGIKYGLTN